MKDGSHLQLPVSELTQFRRDLEEEAEAHDLAITITVEPVDGTVNVTWHVSPKPAEGLVIGAAAGGDAAPLAPAPTATAGVTGIVRAGAVGGAAPVFVLGGVSERFESRGPGDVSGGQGDPGGVSYGSWQMTSQPNGGRVRQFVSEPSFPFAVVFRNLTPGTKPFSDAWRALALSQPDRFKAAQHDFIKRTHFDPVVTNLQARTQVNAVVRSHALQDCIWSTAVQHGPGTTICSDVCLSVLHGMDPASGKQFDEAVIRGIYAERGRSDGNGRLVHFQSSAPILIAGLRRRFVEELGDALAELQTE